MHVQRPGGWLAFCGSRGDAEPAYLPRVCAYGCSLAVVWFCWPALLACACALDGFLCVSRCPLPLLFVTCCTDGDGTFETDDSRGHNMGCIQSRISKPEHLCNITDQNPGLGVGHSHMKLRETCYCSSSTKWSRRYCGTIPMIVAVSGSRVNFAVGGCCHFGCHVKTAT